MRSAILAVVLLKAAGAVAIFDDVRGAATLQRILTLSPGLLEEPVRCECGDHRDHKPHCGQTHGTLIVTNRGWAHGAFTLLMLGPTALVPATSLPTLRERDSRIPGRIVERHPSQHEVTERPNPKYQELEGREKKRTVLTHTPTVLEGIRAMRVT